MDMHKTENEQLDSSPFGWRMKGPMAFVSIWIVLALFASTANFLFRRPEAFEASWIEMFAIHMGYWSLWALFFLLVTKFSPLPSAIASTPLRSGAVFVVFIAIAVPTFAAYYAAVNTGSLPRPITAHTLWVFFTGSAHALSYQGLSAFLATAMILISGQISQDRIARQANIARLAAEAENQKLAVALSDARVSLLRAQIHPHFMFNALNSVAALIATQQNDRAYEAINNLSELLRLTFRLISKSVVSLNEEFALVRATLHIGALRYQDRLTWDLTLPNELRHAQIPPFLLQPLVENSLRHAVGASLEPVKLSVIASRKAELLKLVVVDDGPGMQQNADAATDGIGLKNLRQRLALTFGSAARCSFSNPANGGVRITIEVPLSMGKKGGIADGCDELR